MFMTGQQSKWFKACIHYFDALNQLQIVIMSCYINRDYVFKKKFYEQKIHKKRLKLLIAMQKIRAVSKNKDSLAKLENLYEMVFSLNTLKWRVPDHATFEMCENEFKNISSSLSNTLQEVMAFLQHQGTVADAMVDHTAKLMGTLSNRIDELDQLYRSTLQVVAKDPILFLFFVQDLMALRDGLESIFLGFLNDT